ncbi:unnamed protein product [Caenorhabditis brenneri]
MNKFPSLYELSLIVVAECFEIGIPLTNHVKISPDVQKEIFETVMRMREYSYDEHTKELIQKFRPEKLHLDFGNMQEGTFDEIKELELTELKIERFAKISKYRGSKRKQEGSTGPVIYNFRIVGFLNDILCRETKEGLRVLDIGGVVLFSQNWMEELSPMFPNLEDLNVCGKKMCAADFTSLCSNLPSLRTLNIGNTEIKNLNGLAKLQNLECLSIHSLSFETKEDITDIFELKKLKKLTFGGLGNWNYDCIFEKPHRELETLVCRWRGADNAFLQRIIPKLPRLQTVVANETRITNAAAIPGVSVYVGGTIEDHMKTIGYFRSQCDWHGIKAAFQHFNSTWEEWTDFDVDMVSELEAVIHVFKLGNQCLPSEVGHFLSMLLQLVFLSEIFRVFLHIYSFATLGENYSDMQKLKILNMFLMELKNHLKKRTPPFCDGVFMLLIVGLAELVKDITTENFNVDKICSLAMKSIIHGDGFLLFEYFCANIVNTLMDRMDLSSEYYKTVNFQKVSESLRNIQNEDDFLPERRATAGNVLRFLELFM